MRWIDIQYVRFMKRVNAFHYKTGINQMKLVKISRYTYMCMNNIMGDFQVIYLITNIDKYFFWDVRFYYERQTKQNQFYL